MPAIFIQAAAVTATTQSTPTRYAMPAVDANNPDVMLTNAGAAAWVRFGGNPGDAPLPAQEGQPGSILVTPARPVLVTTNPAVLAGADARYVVNDKGGAAGSVAFSAQSMMAGGTLTVTRGTATPNITF